jgi:hypothetical protein
MSRFQKVIVALGGKKFAAMIGAIVAMVIIAGLRALSGKLGYTLSDTLANAITLKVAAVVTAFVLGQGFADGLSGGATSSGLWQKSDGTTTAPLPTNVIPHAVTENQAAGLQDVTTPTNARPPA